MPLRIDTVINALNRSNLDSLPRGELFINRDFLDHFFGAYTGQYTKQLKAAAQCLGLSAIGVELDADRPRALLSDRACKELEEFFTVGIINGPVSLLIEENGFFNAMLSISKDRSLFHGIAVKFLKDADEEVKSARAKGLQAIAIADDIAGNKGLLFPLHYFSDVVVPVYREVAETAKASGLRTFFHSDGDMRKVIELLVKAGYDCLHPVDTQAGLDLYKLKEEFGERISFMGHIDIISWSKERIEKEIGLAENSFKKGGLILGSTCGLSMKTVSDKLGALYPRWEREIAQL